MADIIKLEKYLKKQEQDCPPDVFSEEEHVVINKNIKRLIKKGEVTEEEIKIIYDWLQKTRIQSFLLSAILERDMKIVGVEGKEEPKLQFTKKYLRQMELTKN